MIRKANPLLSDFELRENLTDLLYEFDTWLFDLDGTLLDSHRQISELLSATLKNFGRGNFSIPQLESKIGLSLEQILIELKIPTDSHSEIISSFRHSLRSQVENGHNTLIDGSIETLAILKAKGIRIGIATNKPSDIARLIVDKTELRNHVDVLFGSTNLTPKPSPDILLACSAHLKSSKVVMVGDQMEDLKAAVSASFAYIGLSPEPLTFPKIKDFQFLTFRSLRDLVNLLIEIA